MKWKTKITLQIRGCLELPDIIEKKGKKKYVQKGITEKTLTYFWNRKRYKKKEK